ncbi:MAG: ferritin-like domain-containing protein [Gammaproteobacteria bacterium]
MNNIFTFAETCLFDAAIDYKLQRTHQAQSLAEVGELSLKEGNAPRPINDTVFPEKPILLMPRDMPRRRFDTLEGKAAFFHALAHIEFMAIYLAWDIIYRFRGLPELFYRDWLRIANEEALHFEMIRAHLSTLGCDYGDLPAHKGLWNHAEDTADDLLARLAVVPRCMEARGLDVTPVMIEKLKGLGDEAGVSILTRIYEDEIGHVERGTYWFNVFARRQASNPEQIYKEKIIRFYRGKPKGPFNREVRIIAGFTNNEIDWLEGRLHE